VKETIKKILRLVGLSDVCGPSLLHCCHGKT